MPENLWQQIWDNAGLLGVVIIIVALFNFDKVKEIIDKILCLIPSYETRAKNGERRHELDLRQIKIAEKERVDTIIVWKDLVLEYRKEMDDLKLENRRDRQACEQRLLEAQQAYEQKLLNMEERQIDLIGNYEKRDVHIIEALRDVTDVIRSHTARLDLVFEWIKEQESKGGR